MLRTKLHLVVNDEQIKRHGSTFNDCKNVLASYYYIKNSTIDYQNKFEHFILDSGAFTLFNLKKNISKDEMIKYCDDYSDFIIKFNIKNYVELDLDSIFGYDFVLDLRYRLENKVGWKCIPIWHISRGKEEFIKMCKEYPYAGIGGIAGGEELSLHKDKFKHLNRLARLYGCKLHGMGFTPSQGLKEHEFYSVDSTSWLSGGRFGQIYLFDKNRMRRIEKPKKSRVVDRLSLNEHNLEEWIKYQEYLSK